ncbi:MAG: hypothetical protein ACXQTZ_00430 [Candidatus Alkanophagales archaeon]
MRAKVLGDMVLLFDRGGEYVGHVEGRISDVGIVHDSGERLFWLSSKSGDPLGMLWLESVEECKDIREAIPNGVGGDAKDE